MFFSELDVMEQMDMIEEPLTTEASLPLDRCCSTCLHEHCGTCEFGFQCNTEQSSDCIGYDESITDMVMDGWPIITLPSNAKTDANEPYYCTLGTLHPSGNQLLAF